MRTSIHLFIAVALPLALFAGCSAGEESARTASQLSPEYTPSGTGLTTNLAALNSEDDDFAAALAPDCSRLLFTSNRRRDAAAARLDDASRFGEAVYGSAGGALTWSAPGLATDAALVAPNTGTATAAGPGVAALFAASYRAASAGGTDLHAGGGSASNLNSGWWDSHPALSPSGELLVFASDRLPEKPNTGVHGRLQTDLYLSHRQGDGSWGVPMKLPAPVNSAANELSPHFGSDGMFYFASDREESSGYDIYRCSIAADGSTDEVQRLPEPINSPADDFFPWMGCDGCTLYLTSNRSGGRGGYDLWAVSRFRTVAAGGRAVLKGPDGGLQPVPGLPLEIAPADGGPVIAASTDAQGMYRAALSACVVYTVTTTKRSCFANMVPLVVGPVATMALDTSIALPDIVYRRDAAPEVDTYSDHVPYFVTGYWYPNTRQHYGELLRRMDDKQLDKARYIDLEDFPYADSVDVIDNKLEEIYTTIDGYMRLLFDTCSLRQDPLSITVVGYVDTLGLTWGVYTDSTVQTTSVEIDGQKLRGMTVERGAVMERQPGNMKLSHLRAWYTYQEIDREMRRRSPRYAELQREGRIVWKYCGGYMPQPARGRYRADPDSRKFDIFIR